METFLLLKQNFHFGSLKCLNQAFIEQTTTERYLKRPLQSEYQQDTINQREDRMENIKTPSKPSRNKHQTMQNKPLQTFTWSLLETLTNYCRS